MSDPIQSKSVTGGKVLISISPDGNVSLAEGLSLSAASKMFWKEVQNHGPAKRMARMERLLVALLTGAPLPPVERWVRDDGLVEPVVQVAVGIAAEHAADAAVLAESRGWGGAAE